MTCPRCGSDQTFDITALHQAQARLLCNGCGRDFVEVEFRPWTGLPGGGVYCGPAATVPVPTPDELLRHAAGLGVVTA